MKYLITQWFLVLAAVLSYLTPIAVAESNEMVIHTSFSSRSSLSDDERTRVSAKIRVELYRTAYQVEELFELRPPSELTVVLLPWTEYLTVTGAPEWTTGMLFRPQVVVIPERMTSRPIEELEKTLRHEYVHAAVALMSRSNSPAWLDEGLAQIVEGSTTTEANLGPLRDYMYRNGKMQLSHIRSDLGRFRPSLVPLAYRYSLFATEHLIRWSDKQALGQFLKLLAKRVPMDDAFSASFGVEIAVFEERLIKHLIRDIQSDVGIAETVT